MVYTTPSTAFLIRFDPGSGYNGKRPTIKSHLRISGFFILNQWDKVTKSGTTIFTTETLIEHCTKNKVADVIRFHQLNAKQNPVCHQGQNEAVRNDRSSFARQL